MRRGINIRKKKKMVLNELNKKSFRVLICLFTLLIACIIIYTFFVQDAFIKINLEKDSVDFSALNESIPFSIKKIIVFSSATAESGSVNQLLSLDISNYCDIGIYLNKIDNEIISISSLYIDNISITSPELGTPCLYKKVISDLGKCSFDETIIIKDRFDLNVINTQEDINYNNYEIYNDCSTPISLGFYNKNIKTDFIYDSTEILYNGTLLKRAKIPLTSLACNISFTINIVTNSSEHYMCNVSLEIPFEDQTGSIYDTGYVTREFDSNETNKFIRIK